MAILHEELRTIAVFDRLHDCDNGDPSDKAHLDRQARRSQVLANIEKLETESPRVRASGVAGIVLLFCVTAYSTFHYLLR